MTATRLGLVGALIALASIAPSASAELRPTPREGATHAVPVFGALVQAWSAPEDDPFAPGHRGIDVASAPGTVVRSSADGVVSFAGSVAGNRTVSVDHPDGIRTTYSYLATVDVARDDVVALGDPIGTTGTGHPSSSLPPHVHLSARVEGTYVDPIGLYVGSSYADLVSLVG